MKLTFALASILVSMSAWSCPVSMEEYAEEEVEASQGVSEKMLSRDGISFFEFFDVASRIQKYYGPILKTAGKKLTVQTFWLSDRVNASSGQKDNSYFVMLHGGLARRKHMTKDAFTLVACHEMGHHLGGYPMYDKDRLRWASSEGQSDYYAALKCFKNIYQGELKKITPELREIPNALKKQCRLQHRSEGNYLLCLRALKAGRDLGDTFFLYHNKKEPSLIANYLDDPSVVSETQTGYSSPVCRSETFRNAALCSVSSITAISKTKENVGVCHGKNGHRVGTRPECWFKPNL